jgi:hypothetical protein
LGCFQHQTYDPAYWAGEGYFALQIAGPGAEKAGDWVTMASGFKNPDPTIPEPGTLALAGLALAGLASLRRRKNI